MSSTLARKDMTNEISSVYLSRLIQSGPLADFSERFVEVLKSHAIDVHLLDSTKDIWLRDFMPVQVGPGQFVQFSLTRDYYLKKDRHKQTDPAPICRALGIEPIIPVFNGQPISLDGGNVIRGSGKAIITAKVFDDNDIPPDILTGILQETLRVDKVIIIPVEPGDDTGHADGMVRFADAHTVVANDYSGTDFPRSFSDEFYGALCGNGLDVLLVPYHPVAKRVNGLWVAHGCYINFLQAGTRIFLPTFGNPAEDSEAIRRFGEIFGRANVVPVPSATLATGGGVLNCCSWEVLVS